MIRVCGVSRQAFVEFCDECHAQLARLCQRATGQAPIAQSPTSAQLGPVIVRCGPDLAVPLKALQGKAAAYVAAARHWATEAVQLARVVAGEDSQSFALYTMALVRCWPEQQPTGISFSKLWAESGF
jgi:hypothetical protein